jgi:integrase
MRGDGRVFQKRGQWWTAYYRSGREHREPAFLPDAKSPQGRRRAASESEALKVLRNTIRSLDRGELVVPAARRVTVNDLLDALLTWMTNQGRASARNVASHLTNVRAAFGDLKAAALTSDSLERYKAQRLAAGRAPATINRELQGLARAFSWGSRQKPPLVADALRVDYLVENNTREGFFARGDFEALLAHVQDADLRDFMAWGFWTGMRLGEIAKLTWSMFDRETWTLRLHARAAKARKPRLLVLVGPLREIIERRIAARRLDCPLIFHRVSKGLPGAPVKDFRKAWARACAAAGLPAGRKGGFTFHDTRRTAVRNLIRSGTDRSVAMRISGHETESMFARYNITAEEDLRTAVERVAAYVSTLPTERKIVSIGDAGAK